MYIYVHAYIHHACTHTIVHTETYTYAYYFKIIAQKLSHWADIKTPNYRLLPIVCLCQPYCKLAQEAGSSNQKGCWCRELR